MACSREGTDWEHVVKVFNLRVSDLWDNRISLRIHERLAVIERTMNLSGLEEDYREMLLGEVAAKIDPARCFAESAERQRSPGCYLG